jgi:hypothetical protein
MRDAVQDSAELCRGAEPELKFERRQLQEHTLHLALIERAGPDGVRIGQTRARIWAGLQNVPPICGLANSSLFTTSG